LKIHLPPIFITCLILLFSLIVDQHAVAQVPAVKERASVSKNSAAGSFEPCNILKIRVFVSVDNFPAFSILKFSAVSNATGILTRDQ